MATVQRIPGCRVIVFYEKEQHTQLQRLLEVFDIFATISFPVDETRLGQQLQRAQEQAA